MGQAYPPLPLQYRLPNPPPVFVGRDHELGVLSAAIERCPVAVLCGPGGVGKTALALQSLSHVPNFDRAKALLIEMRPGQPVEDPRLQIIRILARVVGLERIDWSDVLLENESIGATLIDLAESRGFWIVIDDLHHVEPAAAASLLVLLARYANRSRWIVTSRTAPPPVLDLTPQVMHLGGLADDELRELAAAFVPGLAEAEIDAAIASSGGSPWLLQQLLVTPGEGDLENRLLDGLPDSSLEFLKALASVDRTLGLEALASFARLPVNDVLTTLAQRGLIQRSLGGFRLHDVVRRILRSAQTNDTVLPSPLVAGRPLAAQRDPETLLEGARLLINAGAVDDVLGMLGKCGELLLESGFAPRLWQLFAVSQDPKLHPWRLRCAVALAQPSLLAQLDPPGDADGRGQLLWARGLSIQGDLHSALALATRLHDEAVARDDAQSAADAGLVAVECLAVKKRYFEASAMLESLKPGADAGLQALCESWHLYCLAAMGQGATASRRMKALYQNVSSLPLRFRNDVLLNLAKVTALTGRHKEAYEMAKAVMLSSLPSERCLVVHFLTAMPVGRLAEARLALTRLDPFFPLDSARRRLQAMYTIYHRLMVGDLHNIDVDIVELKRVLCSAGDIPVLGPLLRFEMWHRMYLAEAPRVLVGEDMGGPPIRWSTLYSARWRVRAGESLSESFAEQSDGALDPDSNDSVYASSDLIAEMVRIEARIVSRDFTGALQSCVHILDATLQSGWRTLEAEVRQIFCDLCVLLGRWDDLQQFLAEFAAMAVEIESPRYQAEVRFYMAVLPGKPVDWGVLEQLAGGIDTAPVAARRARFLLGENARLDAVDRRVLGALKTLRGVVPLTSHLWKSPHLSAQMHGEEEPGWGLSEEGHRVWLPDGTSFTLADRPQLWGVLVSMYERGGTATKEQVVFDVWHEREYHPLRHDNRLQVAIRRLRQFVEKDPSQPQRLVTTDGGYALIGRVRRAGVPVVPDDGPTDP